MLDLTITDTGVLHVNARGAARLDWTDPRDGLLVTVSPDAVVVLDDPDVPEPSVAAPAFDGPVRDAGGRLEAGSYPVSFHVPGERAWDTRRHGRVYGTVVEVEGEWTTVRFTRLHRHGDVGELHTMRERLSTEVTARLAAGER